MTMDYINAIHPGIVGGFSTWMMDLVRQVLCAMETG